MVVHYVEHTYVKISASQPSVYTQFADYKLFQSVCVAYFLREHVQSKVCNLLLFTICTNKFYSLIFPIFLSIISWYFLLLLLLFFYFFIFFLKAYNSLGRM